MKELIKHILNESVSEKKKLNLVIQMINNLFDNIDSIEIKEYAGKPMVRVYFYKTSDAINEDTVFADEIQSVIYHYTGLNLLPYWKTDWDDNSDFRLDAVKVDENKKMDMVNETEMKQPKYLNIIKDLVEPFKYDDCICDVNVLYNDEDDMYLIDIEISNEELGEKFFAVVGKTQYVKSLRSKIKETIKDFLPINNFYVGSHSTPKCGFKF